MSIKLGRIYVTFRLSHPSPNWHAPSMSKISTSIFSSFPFNLVKNHRQSYLNGESEQNKISLGANEDSHL